jgi:PAS domain S-box-containing protein
MHEELSPKKLSPAVGAESEGVYRDLFESSRDALMIAEPPSGRITSVNLAAVKIYGAKNKEELISLSPKELSPERQPDGRESAEKAREMIATAIRDGSHFFEWTHRRITGEEFPAEVLLTKMERDGKVFHQATVRDITERKQAEDALRKARERTDWLAQFPEENPAPVMRVSLEGRVIYRNPAATQLPGWACEVDQPLSELLLALLRKAIAEARQIEQDAELMGRWYSVSVAPFPAEGYANIYGIDITIRKEAEVALREMQRQQRALLDNSPDMVWLKDKEGRFVAVNEAISKAYGHSSEELIGKTDFAFVPPELAESYQADDKYVMESRQRQRFVEPFVDAAGNSTVIETIKTPITNDRGEMIGTAGVARDITERIRAEETRQIQSAALEAAANAIAITDSDGTILWFNSAFTALTGYTREEAFGKNQRILKSGKQDAAFYAELWQTIKGGNIWHGELINRRKDGRLYTEEMTITPVRNAAGEISHFIAIKQDVTVWKLIEESRRHLATIVEQSDDAITSGDLDGKFTTWNAAAQRLYNYAAEEILGRPVSVIVPRDRMGELREILEKLQSGEHIQHHETVRLKKGGIPVNVSITVSPIKNDAGQVTGISAITRDITERKCADEALQESNRQLQDALGELKSTQEQAVRQERLSALGTMASGIAHDFNNSLTAILGGSELLLQRPEYLGDKETTRSYIEMINIAAQDAGKVVNRLREFYRHREDHEFFVPVNINDLVGQAIALTQPKWKAGSEVQGISVDVHTDLQEVPPIAGSAAELREALTNLILNAVDAMPRGGTITIRTCRDDGHVVLKIGDTGTGMSQEVRCRCLEPFFTTKGGRGTGLGLSMVYGILQRHRGTIDIESEVGKGTTFIIHLPVQIVQPQSKPLATPASVAQHLHVLVVDDEAVVRKIVGEYLKFDGHIVEAANSGHDGLEKFRNSRFDLVLVDRAMPGMSGDQLAAAIKSAEPKVPVVMLTGFGSMMDAADEKPAGVDLVLGKPITINALRTAMSKVVASVN